jgi:hypothetical protein
MVDLYRSSDALVGRSDLNSTLRDRENSASNLQRVFMRRLTHDKMSGGAGGVSAMKS